MKHILAVACIVALGSSVYAHSFSQCLDKEIAEREADLRAMETIDKYFGPVDPDSYELDYSEKCDLIDQSDIQIKLACKQITKE